MDLYLQRLFTLLITSPGNLIYYLVLSFTVLAVWVNAVHQARLSSSPRARRMASGLGLLLGIHLTQFVLNAAAFSDLIPMRELLPVLDRFVIVISLVIIFWLWGFPTPSRMADAATLLLGLLVAVALVFSYFIWQANVSTAWFNMHWLGFAWDVSAIVITIMAVLLLLILRPAEWGLGLIFFVVHLVGFSANLVFVVQESDYSGILRITHIISYPLLFVLLQRFLLPYKDREKEVTPIIKAPSRRRFGVEPNVLGAVLSVVTDRDSTRLCQSVVRMVSQAMLADICFLLTLPDHHGDIILQCSYDLIREKSLPGSAFNENSAPIVAAALGKGRALRLPASSLSPDLSTLSTILDLQINGHLMMVPVLSASGGTPMGGLAVLSPYSNRNWSVDEQGYLEQMGLAVGQLIASSAVEHEKTAPIQDGVPDHKLSQLRKDLESARSAVEMMTQQNESLAMELERVRSNTQDGQLASDAVLIQLRKMEEELDNAHHKLAEAQKSGQEQIRDHKHLQAAHDEALKIIQTLQRENERLSKALQEVMESQPFEWNIEGSDLSSLAVVPSFREEAGQFESELRNALQAIARLQSLVGEANIRMFLLEREAKNSADAQEHLQVIVDQARELRQPMATVMGYTDFLLSESVGILGGLQRKFLERIRVSIERLDEQVSTLLDSAEAQFSKLSLIEIEDVDIGTVIDQAIEQTSSILREKNITLQINFPEQMPKVNGDADALSQVFFHLLNNAGLATPQDGEIVVHAILERYGEEQDFLHFIVKDTGPGISPANLSRVFDPGTKPGQIPGLGQMTSGLILTKSLVDAHGGRIWVESNPLTLKGATFRVLLPIVMHPNSERTT